MIIHNARLELHIFSIKPLEQKQVVTENILVFLVSH